MRELLQGCRLVVVSVFAFTTVAFAGGSTQTNPPSECNASDSDCECESGEGASDGCIKVSLDMGRTTPWTGSQKCALKVFADDQSPMVFTPDSLFAVMGYTFKRIGNRLLPDGETPAEVVFSHPGGEAVRFVFSAGESLGRPDPGIHVKMDERLMMVDAAGWACTNAPVYYDLFENDGTVRRFLATDMTVARGRLVSITDSRGVVRTSAEMGIDIVYNADGVRQFLTPSRLADVHILENGYEVSVYPVGDAPPARDATTGLYPISAASPVRYVSVRSENGGNRAVVTFRRGEAEPDVSVFDWRQGDWSMTRASGVSEIRERSVVDSKEARTVKESRSRTGELMARSEYNYVWKSWGFAATNHVEGFGGVTRTTSWTYVTVGNGKGQVKAEIGDSGLRTDFAYDGADRLVSKTTGGADVATEKTVYSYDPVDSSDAALPVDTRPRTVMKTRDGIEYERTYYVYSSLTGVVERVGTPGAPYGGANALRTVTAYYPAVANDIRAGRVKSIRHEDGRLDVYGYALASNVWTETVTHLHERVPSPVEGRTTRDVTCTNARGDVVETRTEAFVGGSWHAITRTRRVYNLEGKCVRSEDLSGQVTTTAWDCCHKVAETGPDGSTVTWDYDEYGRMVEVSRLVPRDLTNVTWVSTCYAYDDLGRQASSWQTNRAAHVGIPETRVRYDPLGRIAARTDILGNETETEYSSNGLTTETKNPNGSTAVAVRDARGEFRSIVGTAVTPEFRTTGVTAGGIRWTRVVHGETPDSPRFTLRCENMLGQVVREERSGFRGVALVTAHEYDAYGRLVCTVSDGEPTVAYAYDDFGARVAEIRTVGDKDSSYPSEWRRSESHAHYAQVDGSVWHVTTNVDFCSDAAIAPLVTSRRVQLTGLTAANPARRMSIDVRGNATEFWTEFADGIVTTCRRVPEATNVISARARLGVQLETISLSAVTNRVVYDALGRACAEVDGRGNATCTKYDVVGRRAATYDGAGNPTRYAYDRFGRLAAVTNALGHAVVYEYDLRGRKTYEGGATYPVRYSYDVFSNRASMTTYRDESRGVASGDVTRWLYDEASGLLTNKVYVDGLGPQYEYDANGRLVKRTWARGIDTTYAYDEWGALTNTAYSDGTPTVSVRNDALGRQVGAHDAAGVTTFAYDAYGANTNETVVGVAGTNVLERFTDAYGRDVGYALNGERRTVIFRDTTTGRIAAMRVVGCTNDFAWTHHPGCDLKRTLRYPNGALVTWEYEPQRDLMTLVSNDIYSAFRYTYDVAGKRVSKNDECYFYNARGELTLATNVVTGAEFAYRYDDIGNRLWSREFGTNCTYAANGLNQYTDVVRGGVSERSTFDLDGNQTNVVTATGEWAVEYNGENRPVRWTRTTDGATVLMAYDRMGRRVMKDDETFVYDGYLNVSRTIWDPTEPVATRPIVVLKSVKDGSSNVLLIHDAGKNIVGELMAGSYKPIFYTPFGTHTSSVDDTWRYSSEYEDVFLGNVYYNFRSYDKQGGRWMVRDPMSELSMTILAAFKAPIFEGNCYLFVGNDGILKYDYVGLFAPWLAGCGVGACIGGIGGALGGAGGGAQGVACGAAAGALSGCASGAACASGSPQICMAGSCVAGLIGSVANSICTQGAGAMGDPCAWVSAILTAATSCASGTSTDLEMKEKIILFITGMDVSAWSGICGQL